MTNIEVINAIFNRLGLVILYFFIAFGPGVVLGIVVANITYGRGKKRLLDKHKQQAEEAFEHIKKYDPKDPRWQ